jgi:protein transport protein SEC31
MTEDTVKAALIVGNFEAAVECCFRTGNLADALILASCGGAELWSKTQERYFELEAKKRPFLCVVSAIIRNQVRTTSIVNVQLVHMCICVSCMLHPFL